MKKSTPWLIGILAALITFVSLFSFFGHHHHLKDHRWECYAWQKNNAERPQDQTNNLMHSWRHSNDKASQHWHQLKKPWDRNEKHSGK